MRLIWPVCVLVLVVGCGGDHPSSGAHAKSGSAGAVDAGPDTSNSVDANSGAGGSADSDASVGNAGEAGEDGGGVIEIEPDDGLKSGTRLKIEWRDFGGTRKFANFYDTVLDSPCVPSAWADGNIYCVPTSSSTVSLMYLNEDCTGIIAEVTHNAACPDSPVPYLVDQSNSGCGAATSHVYKLNPTKLTLTTDYATQNGGCAGPFSAQGAYSEHYAMESEVQPADLVQFTREPLADSGRLSRQYEVSADGARFPIAPHDQLLDADCTPKTDFASHTAGSCPPLGVAGVSYFGDLACMQGKLSVTSACNKPEFAVQAVDPSCPAEGNHYFRVGAAETATPLFIKRYPDCVSTTGSGASSYYGLGDSVAIPPLSRFHDAAPGRDVQAIHFSDGKSGFLDSPLYDAVHQTECLDYMLADGSILCAPVGISVSTYYSDEMCTTTVDMIQAFTGPARCGAPAFLTPFAIKPVGSPNGTCGAGFEVYETGVEYGGALFQNSGTCTKVDEANYRFYTVGPQHPLSDFPLATVTRDP